MNPTPLNDSVDELEKSDPAEAPDIADTVADELESLLEDEEPASETST